MSNVSAAPKGIFAGIKDVKVFTRAEYLRPGQYWMRIDCCKTGLTRGKALFAAVECTVVKVLDNNQGRGHPVGCSVTDFIQTGDYFLRDINQFISALMAVPSSDITEEQADIIFGPDQPLAGMVGEVHATEITLKNGNLFTAKTWKREVPASECLASIDAVSIGRFFTGKDDKGKDVNLLQARAAADAAVK